MVLLLDELHDVLWCFRGYHKIFHIRKYVLIGVTRLTQIDPNVSVKYIWSKSNGSLRFWEVTLPVIFIIWQSVQGVLDHNRFPRSTVKFGSCNWGIHFMRVISIYICIWHISTKLFQADVVSNDSNEFYTNRLPGRNRSKHLLVHQWDVLLPLALTSVWGHAWFQIHSATW